MSAADEKPKVAGDEDDEDEEDDDDDDEEEGDDEEDHDGEDKDQLEQEKNKEEDEEFIEEKVVEEEVDEQETSATTAPEVGVAVVIDEPLKVMYQKRNLLDLFENVVETEQFTRYTILPENNVNCFFQNRAQYWRLSGVEQPEYQHEKCPCCDFTYPSTHAPQNQGPMSFAQKNANAVTDSLKAFLRANEPPPTIVPQPNATTRRFMNQFSTNTQYNGYPMNPPQQSPPQQLFHPQNNGFSNNTNNNYNTNNNNTNNSNYNQQMNPYMSTNGYGTTLALLNLMNNASKNAAHAFQSLTGGNNTRGYGIHKQF